MGDLESSGDEFDDIEQIEIHVHDADADFTLYGLDLERESQWNFGTQEVYDADDEDFDTETVREPSGEYSIMAVDTLGSMFSDAIIEQLKVLVDFEAGLLDAEQVEYTFEETDRYSQDYIFGKVVTFDLPVAFDLTYEDLTLNDVGVFPSTRHVENEGYPNRSEYLRELVRDDLPDGLLADIRNERIGQNVPRQWRSH